jgi:amidase
MSAYYWSAVRMARAIETGETSAEEALRLCLDRIARHDGELRAVCNLVEERAHRRARAADRALAQGRCWGPLHGVPMTVKEGYDLVGTPTTWGHPEHARNFPRHDSDAVLRLEQAGAVVFGKTNVPVALRDWQSENPIYGRTLNPWDKTRTPGGSSGGSAVALAVGYTFLEAGSDIGGSLRNPAHFCGVCAHKPTYGIVPTRGHTLVEELVPSDISVCGPMARTASDLALGLDIMTGVDGPAATAWRLELPKARRDRLEGARIAVVLDSPVCAVAGEIKEAIASIADRCEAGGAEVVRDVALPVDDAECHRLYIQLLRAVLAPSLGDEELAREHAQVARLAQGDSSYRAQVCRALTQSYRDWHRAHEARARMQRAWAAFFERHDALLIPAAPTTAWPHDTADRFDRVIRVDEGTIGYYDELFWAGLTGVVYLPSTVVPIAIGSDGLPIGVQIVGPYLEDRTPLALAREIEILSGGFRPPPGYE